MNDHSQSDIYSTPDSGRKASRLLAGQPKKYPLVVVFFLALAATVILSEIYWSLVDLCTTLAVVAMDGDGAHLRYVYNLTSYKILTAIPAALPDIYSGNIVARRCRQYPYHCLAAVYATVLVYLNWEAPVGLTYEFTRAIAVDLLYVAAAFTALHYYRRKYKRAAARLPK